MKDSNTQSEPESELVLLLEDEYSGIDVAETIIIKEPKRLQSFYSKINRTRKPGFPVPEVDFTKEIIVIQCNGLQNYSSLPVLSFREETSAQIIIDSKMKKESDATANTLITNPFCVYKMPFTQKEIIVKKSLK